eukprot:12401586-Karenia_brevis.AAC.1
MQLQFASMPFYRPLPPPVPTSQSASLIDYYINVMARSPDVSPCLQGTCPTYPPGVLRHDNHGSQSCSIQ